MCTQARPKARGCEERRSQASWASLTQPLLLALRPSHSTSPESKNHRFATTFGPPAAPNTGKTYVDVKLSSVEVREPSRAAS
jgi:hypothetical protein